MHLTPSRNRWPRCHHRAEGIGKFLSPVGPFGMPSTFSSLGASRSFTNSPASSFRTGVVGVTARGREDWAVLVPGTEDMTTTMNVGCCHQAIMQVRGSYGFKERWERITA